MSRLATLACLSLLGLPLAAQQGRGSFFGIVTDASGAAVPGAKITVTSLGTNTATTLETNNEGFYSAPALQIGDYSINAVRQGFKSVVRTVLNLQVDQRAEVDFRLI